MSLCLSGWDALPEETVTTKTQRHKGDFRRRPRWRDGMETEPPRPLNRVLPVLTLIYDPSRLAASPKRAIPRVSRRVAGKLTPTTGPKSHGAPRGMGILPMKLLTGPAKGGMLRLGSRTRCWAGSKRYRREEHPAPPGCRTSAGIILGPLL